MLHCKCECRVELVQIAKVRNTITIRSTPLKICVAPSINSKIHKSNNFARNDCPTGYRSKCNVTACCGNQGQGQGQGFESRPCQRLTLTEFVWSGIIDSSLGGRGEETQQGIALPSTCISHHLGRLESWFTGERMQLEGRISLSGLLDPNWGR